MPPLYRPAPKGSKPSIAWWIALDAVGLLFSMFRKCSKHIQTSSARGRSRVAPLLSYVWGWLVGHDQSVGGRTCAIVWSARGFYRVLASARRWLRRGLRVFGRPGDAAALCFPKICIELTFRLAFKLRARTHDAGTAQSCRSGVSRPTTESSPG